ncbi:MAG: pyridoxamine 5'-phosphate oxidase family protein [Spirochaetales bacterium]|nr:pyridoxamine 5'-phosphate oxidase family protein [Spirochaetales bacterium]
MNKQDVLRKIESILEDAGTGLLAMIDSSGYPRMRWMTPSLLKGNNQALYAVTSPNFQKIKDLEKNPHVEWMLQSPSLSEILTINGRINIIDNPSLKLEILENIGNKLTMFWRVNSKNDSFVVLETVMESAFYFVPMKGIVETFNLKVGE